MSYLIEALLDWLSFRWIWRRFRRTAERSSSPWWARARSERHVLVRGDVEFAGRRAREVALRYGEERQTDSNNVVEIVTPANGRTSGSVVQMTLRPSNGGTDVTVAAWPGAQLFDWGASKRTADAICRDLGPD